MGLTMCAVCERVFVDRALRDTLLQISIGLPTVQKLDLIDFSNKIHLQIEYNKSNRCRDS